MATPSMPLQKLVTSKTSITSVEHLHNKHNSCDIFLSSHCTSYADIKKKPGEVVIETK
jgi:hypothetical protein